MQSGEEQPENNRQQYANIIKQTRKIITHMDQEQRFLKAKSHVLDALTNRQPRPVNFSSQHTQYYHVLYWLQSSVVWSGLLFLLAYVFMYLVVLDNQSYTIKITIEAVILLVIAIDIAIDFYCQSFNRLTIKNKYPKLLYIKTIVTALMLVDLVIFIVLPGEHSRPIRPFRILRAALPVIYDQELRRSLIALFSAYKELLAFIVYYSIIIGSFALIGSRTLTFDPSYVQPDPFWRDVPYAPDQYYNNYNHLSRMIYHMYGVSTWDFYPDFQILAVQNYQPNYIFYIVFIFFNMFLFAAIPGAVIYNKFRVTRSRYIIFDEIKQQHSLILAFVTLAQEELNLSMNVLVKFLFHFYRKKIRYIQYITEICMKLDDNNNGTIQVNQFMQLSKVILYNSVMYPPRFEDIQWWIKFRESVNEQIQLEKIVLHWMFDAVVSFITVLASANALILLFHGNSLNRIFDSIFIWLFFAQLLIRIIAVGPQTYFAYRWNQIDSFLISLNVIFFFVTTNNSNIDNLFIINRVFRVAFLLRTVIMSRTVRDWNNEFIFKFRRLFETFAQIFPIITRFFLLFAFFFFVFGILGMQFFYSTEKNRDPSSPYDQFSKFNNFQTFVHSQYIMMQILTQGAWAKVVYDYCYQNPELYGLVITYFMLMHFVIVYINSTLLKGIFWEIYFTVSSILDQMEERVKNQEERDRQMQEKTDQIDRINEQINQNQTLEPDTIIKRQIIEMKMDMDILKRLNHIQEDEEESNISRDLQKDPESQRAFRSFHRSKLVSQMMENWNINAKDFKRSRHRKRSLLSPKLKRKKVMDFRDMQDKQDQDFHSQMQDLLNRLIISSRIRYSYVIAYPTIFVNFLNNKFKQVQQFVENKFDIHLNPLENEESLKFHVYQLSAVVKMQFSQRQKKQLIIDCLVNNQLIDQEKADRIMKTKMLIKKFHIEANGALKKTYLEETNQDLIKKLQIEYFSDVYGHTFKQINKVSLQPLLKVEASLTYTFWNVLSYPQISYSDFFHFLTFIQDQISNKILKPGSLFKFVYKVATDSDIWFTIERKRHQDTSVRFIKSGLWAYTPEMEDNQIYYARDIFKWQNDLNASQNISSIEDEKTHEQYMKLFFQSFQTLAFGLTEKNLFFQSNPKHYIYDLYLQNFDVAPRRNSLTVPSGNNNQLKVSNIMMVVLSKQEERLDIGEEVLNYSVSEIKNQRKRKIKQDFFLLDDEQKETFEKLKNLSAVDQQKIIESQGMPFSYIINLMKQMSQILQLYSGNFLNHIEKAVNDKYGQLDASVLSDISMSMGEGQEDIVRILPEMESWDD